MTYKQAYDKIIEAYFKDEIHPLDSSFCFCGTLCDNKTDWFGSARYFHFDSHGYKGDDFVLMETALLDTIYPSDTPVGFNCIGSPGYEQLLFEGMCAALDVLKQIHIERGEAIDEVPEFTKRQLVKP